MNDFILNILPVIIGVAVGNYFIILTAKTDDFETRLADRIAKRVKKELGDIK